MDIVQKTPNTPPYLDREEVPRLINALTPATDDRFPKVDLKISLAAQAALVKQHSCIPTFIRNQGEEIFEQWRNVLEPIPGHPGKYVISDDLLRGLIARSGITASMLALLASGAAKLRQQEVADVEQLLTPERDDTVTDDGLRGVDEFAPPVA